ncbi:MAG: hypothetical protein OXC59_09010 [Acidimicrobiaceae bacterium]|nr:hypothetical protein [Acidimicrobiaceae bacterium]
MNDRLAAALDAMHPRWVVEAESTRVFADAAAKAPDIVVRMPGGLSVVIETEYAPAADVEAEALGRLNMTLTETGERVEQVVALRIPESLSEVRQAVLSQALTQAELDYCVLSSVDGRSVERFPARGFISGTADALAGLIESIAVSERRLARRSGCSRTEFPMPRPPCVICSCRRGGRRWTRWGRRCTKLTASRPRAWP